MNAFANALIDAMGGTTAVAARAKTGVSTVHHWRRKGLSPSRLDHLRRIAHDEMPSLDIGAIAHQHGVDLSSIDPAKAPSPGKGGEVSATVSA